MSKLNVKPAPFTETTHGGAKAVRATPYQQLRRSVLSCLLWEDEFYEEGETISSRILKLVEQVPLDKVGALAIEARTKFNLRHISLLLLSAAAMCGSKSLDRKVLDHSIYPQVIQRADELAELLAIHAKLNGTTPDKIKKHIPWQMKRGLAAAFNNFDEYQLAKYDREGVVRLRDVLILCHAKPRDTAQEALWKRLLDSELKTPDTWEVALSGGADKKETFTRLINEGQLGYFALIRNLRKMTETKVDPKLIRQAILARKNGAHRILPFRFITAAKHAPQYESELDTSMMISLKDQPKLKGKTVIIIDVSASMGLALSVKGELDRAHSACAIAAIAREMCEDPVIYATAGSDASRVHKTALIPNRHGMALIEAIWGMSAKLGGGGIFLKQAMDYVANNETTADRCIVITDEQDCDNKSTGAPALAKLIAPNNYMCNVASAKNGIGYGRWTQIDGFSEAVLTYIREFEDAQWTPMPMPAETRESASDNNAMAMG